MELAQEKLKRSVENTELVEVLQVSSSEGGDIGAGRHRQKVALQMRVKPGAISQWLSIVDFLLQEEEEQDSESGTWSLHVCKTFMRNEERLGFVWTLVLSTMGDLKSAVADVSRTIRVFCASAKSSQELPGYNQKVSSPQAVQRAAQVVANKVVGQGQQPIMYNIGNRVEVEAMPLIGVTQDRNKPQGPNGRGAKLIQGR